MSAGALCGVLVDVGGTLWPDAWPERVDDVESRATALVAALPWLSGETALELAQVLNERAAALGPVERLDSRELVREVARGRRLSLDEWEAAAVRRAMCLPAAGRVDLFPSARELLATSKALGLRCVAISNGIWRDGDAYRRDFEEMGVGRFVDVFVSSINVGFRKPHPAIFEAALAAIRCPAGACVMIGNSEQNDIEPALALQMRAIRVAIEEPVPEASAAHAIARSLHEAADILRSWAWAEGSSS